jgi:hypothetical protein
VFEPTARNVVPRTTAEKGEGIMNRARFLLFVLVAAVIAALIGPLARSRPQTAGKMVISVMVEGGSGQLKEGRADIKLRESFASGTRNWEHSAQVTPRDEKAKGYLYVHRLSSDQLVVVESAGGKSDARFDYIVVATQWSR